MPVSQEAMALALDAVINSEASDDVIIRTAMNRPEEFKLLQSVLAERTEGARLAWFYSNANQADGAILRERYMRLRKAAGRMEAARIVAEMRVRDSAHPAVPEPDTEDATDDETFTCADCNDEFPADELHGTENGDVCASCFEDYASCDDCGDVVHNDEIHGVTNRRGREAHVCTSCEEARYTGCSSCNETFHDDLIHRTADGGAICDECYCDSYFTCEECSDVFHCDDMHGEYRCEACHDDRSSDHIQSYGTDADKSLGFIGKPKDGLYAGIELEVESYGDLDEDAGDTLDALGHDYAILKADGSIDCQPGFEIVTAPADLDTHRERIMRFGANRPRTLKSFDGKAELGMHVHISRKPISQLTIGKIGAFLGAPENRKLVEKVAQRPSGRWARIQEKTVSQYGPHKIQYEYNRYQALNVSNANTIEFRIFKGTLKAERILANLEFCVACVKFCANAGINELDVPTFLAFVASAPKRFPYLAALLREWAMIPAPKAKPVCV